MTNGMNQSEDGRVPIRSLDDALAKVEESEKHLLRLGGKALEAGGGELFPFDLLVVAACTRAIRVSKGYRTLMGDRNYVAAYPLVRLAMDCCLCLCGGYLVDGIHDYAMHVVGGGRISDYKSRDGKRLHDSLLRDFLHERYPDLDVNEMYKQCSGWIHMSTKHLLSTLETGDEDDDQRTLHVQIGGVKELPETEYVGTTLSLMVTNAMLCRLVVEWHNTKMVGKAKSDETFEGKLYDLKMPDIRRYVRTPSSR